MERHPPPAQHSLSTVSFSEDSTIMATGFTESYIRLWSLNGKGLRALRTDLTGDEVNKTTDGALPFSSSSPLVRFFLSRHDDKMRPD
jgi:WD40 repeat protein